MAVEKRVPRVRFADFEEEWQVKGLAELASIQRGRFSPRPRNNPIYYNGDIPFVQTSDVVNSNGYIITYSQTLNEEGLKVSKLFPKGTILMTIAANIGYCGILELDMACPDSLIGLICREKIYNRYLNFYLSTQQKKIDYLAPQGAQRNINISFLEPYLIFYPTLPEQQKIAAFLTTIDTRIQQLSRKKALLEQYKKGVMQQIFSQEIHFKDEDGKEFPAWEEKRLGEVSEINPKCKDLPETFIYIDLESVEKGTLKKEERIHREEAPSRAQRLLENKDILFQMVRPYQKNNLFFDKGEGYVASTGYAQIRTRNSQEYLFQFLHTDHFVQNVLIRCTGTSYPAINSNDLSGIKIALPSLPEQQKIAAFLSTIDRQINLVGQQLERVQTFKKGLLQQMFV